MNDEYQTQQYWNNNMKKTELKEIIRKEVRKAIDESQGLDDFFYEPSETPAQGKNAYVVSFPFILPAANGSAGVSTVIHNQDNFDNWKTKFNQYFPGEKPMFKKSTFYDNGWDVTNPSFIKRRKESDKNVSGYMAQQGTEGD